MPREPLDVVQVHLLAGMIKAVANANRLRILAVIAAHPGIAAYQVRDALGDVTQSTVSVHLGRMKAAGLVDSGQYERGYPTALTVSRDGMQTLAAAIRRLR